MGTVLGVLWVVGMVKVCEGEVVEVVEMVDLLGSRGVMGRKGKGRGGICTVTSLPRHATHADGTCSCRKCGDTAWHISVSGDTQVSTKPKPTFPETFAMSKY